MYLDGIQQIVHRLIGLYLAGVYPEHMERMELRHFQIDDFSLFHWSGGSGAGGSLLFGGGDCRLSGFRRRRTAGTRFLAIVGFLAAGHVTPNRERSPLTGHLANLRRAACAGFWRFLVRGEAEATLLPLSSE